MGVSKHVLTAVFLIGSLSATPLSVGAAEKSGKMEHDKGMMKEAQDKMKEDKGMMEEGSKDKAKGAKSGDKMMKDDKMKK